MTKEKRVIAMYTGENGVRVECCKDVQEAEYSCEGCENFQVIDQGEIDVIIEQLQAVKARPEPKPEKGISKEARNKILKVSDSWNWENFRDNNGKYWTVFQALYCKLSWVLEGIKATKEHEELESIVIDTMTIVEALQKEIKL